MVSPVTVDDFDRSTSLAGSAAPGAFAGGAAGIDRRIPAVGGGGHLDAVADRRVDHRPQEKPRPCCAAGGRKPAGGAGPTLPHGDPLYGIRGIARTQMQLPSARQSARLTGVFDTDEHLAVKVVWLIYQRIIAA